MSSIAMGQYRFVISDGSQTTDLVELPDVAAARREAARVIAKLAGSEPDDLWTEGALRLSVQNADGLILFEIDIVVTTAPAHPEHKEMTVTQALELERPAFQPMLASFEGFLSQRHAWFDGQLDLDAERRVFTDETRTATNDPQPRPLCQG